jgi:hypothetical protein
MVLLEEVQYFRDVIIRLTYYYDVCISVFCSLCGMHAVMHTHRLLFMLRKNVKTTLLLTNPLVTRISLVSIALNLTSS